MLQWGAGETVDIRPAESWIKTTAWVEGGKADTVVETSVVTTIVVVTTIFSGFARSAASLPARGCGRLHRRNLLWL